MLATAEWVHWAGTIRPHSAIGMRTPAEHEAAWAPDRHRQEQSQPATTGTRQTSHHKTQGLTHIQVRLATWQALEAEDLLTSALERADALKRQLVLDGDDDLTALLLAVSDNGAQMIATSTRRFMAMVAITQHFGRPATPTNQAWIKSLNGTLKTE